MIYTRLFDSPKMSVLKSFITWSETGQQTALDEGFVISSIIKVKVGVVSPSQALIILDITKTESNNTVFYTLNKKSCFCSFTDRKQHKACKLDMITLRNHARQSYLT